MRVVVQRCKQAKVSVNGEIIGQIDHGFMLLVGITHEDTEQDVQYLAKKIVGLRIFEDEQEKMNLSLKEVEGKILSVSQFTLYGNVRKGKRPNFTQAAKPEQARSLYVRFNQVLRELGVEVQTGIFGEMMDVTFTNWGPVTLIIDSLQQ